MAADLQSWGLLPPLSEVKDSFRVVKLRKEEKIFKPVMMSLGPALENLTPPMPDLKSMTNKLLGGQKRVGFAPPIPDKKMLRKLRSLTRYVLKKCVHPLEHGIDLSVPKWLLNNKSYTAKEKMDLLKIHSEMMESEPINKHIKVGGFLKEETYLQFKYPRGINARPDEFKIMLGPVAAAMEEVIFKTSQLQRFFIKKVPANLRAQFMMDNIYSPTCQYFTNDFTGYEGLLTPALMRNCEFLLYSWMVSGLAKEERELYVKLFRSICFGLNRIECGNIVFEIEGCRMSGEMVTSLGNGFTNLMISLLWFDINGIEIDDVFGVVEGDDSLFRMSVIPPDEEFYSSLGLKAKMEIHKTINTASFCGQLFAEGTTDIICDPNKALLNFGWASSRYLNFSKNYHLALLRAKAWSYGYQYQACPIISSMARAYLRLTRSHDLTRVLRDMDLYKRAMLIEAMDAGRPELNKKVDDRSRSLMHEVFGISPELQIKYENYFDSLEEIKNIPDFGLIAHDDCSFYHEHYVMNLPKSCSSNWNLYETHQPINASNLTVNKQRS